MTDQLPDLLLTSTCATSDSANTFSLDALGIILLVRGHGIHDHPITLQIALHGFLLGFGHLAHAAEHAHRENESNLSSVPTFDIISICWYISFSVNLPDINA